MSEMVERIARALAPKAWADLDARGLGTLANQNRRTASLRHARAVLATMREPTASMAWAANDACPDMPRETTWRQLGETIWRAMIDAALSPSPSPQERT